MLFKLQAQKFCQRQADVRSPFKRIASASLLEKPQALRTLAFVCHKRDGMFKSGNTPAHDRKAAVVIVVPKKTCLSSPHGIEVTSPEPFLIDRVDVDVGVRHEAVGILPVVRVENFRDGMGGAAPLKSFQPCEENGIADNPMAVSVIFVPASLPVSHYDVRFPIFSFCVVWILEIISLTR